MRYATVDGPALRALRKAKNNPSLQHDLSLRALATLIAERLGLPAIHFTMFSKVENGERQPSDEVFKAWCGVLNTDPAKLATVTVPPELAARVAQLGGESRAS